MISAAIGLMFVIYYYCLAAEGSIAGEILLLRGRYGLFNFELANCAETTQSV